MFPRLPRAEVLKGCSSCSEQEPQLSFFELRYLPGSSTLNEAITLTFFRKRKRSSFPSITPSCPHHGTSLAARHLILLATPSCVDNQRAMTSSPPLPPLDDLKRRRPFKTTSRASTPISRPLRYQTHLCDPKEHQTQVLHPNHHHQEAHFIQPHHRTTWLPSQQSPPPRSGAWPHLPPPPPSRAPPSSAPPPQLRNPPSTQPRTRSSRSTAPSRTSW